MIWGELKQKHGKNENLFFKWRQIVSAIPRGWKDIVAREVASGNVCEIDSKPHLQYISRIISLNRLTGKEMYIILINKMWEKPTSEDKIEQLLGETNLVWFKIYMLGKKIKLDSYSRQFHFKLTHNILYLNKALKRMNLVHQVCVCIVVWMRKHQYIYFRMWVCEGGMGTNSRFF